VSELEGVSGGSSSTESGGETNESAPETHAEIRTCSTYGPQIRDAAERTC
jgi:hypothetical protein